MSMPTHESGKALEETGSDCDRAATVLVPRRAGPAHSRPSRNNRYYPAGSGILCRSSPPPDATYAA